jgi:hypothetical protein
MSHKAPLGQHIKHLVLAPVAAADAGHRQAAHGSRRDSIEHDTAVMYLAENVEKGRVQQ